VPSLLHEGIVALVREKPELAADLLRQLLHVAVPAFTEARLAEASLNDLVPTEYRADAVVLLVDGTPVFGIIVEARSGSGEAVHLADVRHQRASRYRCPVVVLVVTPDAATARWAAEPVDLGGDTSWRSLVVGPEGIPVITDPSAATREPHLAVLSAMAHGRDDDVGTAVAVAAAAASGAATLPEPLRMLCFALIESSLGDAARKTFEMLPQNERFMSELMSKLTSERQVRSLAEGEARALLRVLERRDIATSVEQRERVLACSDLATLEAWLDRAAMAPTAQEVFGD
jgi:hypothetical protein